jgi:hypothetical protein
VAERPDLLLAHVFEDLEDLAYKSLSLLGREISGVDGLLVGLKVTEVGLLGQVTVYKAHNGLDLLARESVAAAG